MPSSVLGRVPGLARRRVTITAIAAAAAAAVLQPLAASAQQGYPNN